MKLLFPSFFFLSIALWSSAAQASAATAPTATTTTLAIASGDNAITSGGSVPARSEVTLTAEVSIGSTRLTFGQVNFCDAAAIYCTDIHLLGTAQLIQSGASAGTATLRFHPGIGNHSYKAVFAGTPGSILSYAASTSNTVTLTVTGTFPTTTAIAASGSAGNYTLTATVTGQFNASTLPALGTVSFLDTTSSDLSLGTATLGTGTTALSFVDSSSPSTLPWPQAVAVADFNGDGKLDLAIPVYSIFTPSSDVTILLGNGDGTFMTGPTAPATGQNANNAAVADFNGDGNADIALSLPDANQVQVLLGNGDGTFTEMPPISAGEVYAVAAADLNGDGKTDLIAVICATQSLSILLGNGDGTFTQGSTPSVSGCPSSVAVGDFNGDGIPDLAVAINTDQTGVPSSVDILIGNGDGTFTAKAESPATGDNPISIVAADFRGNGILDLAVANLYVDTGQPGTVTVLLGNGDGTFTPTAVSPVVGILPYSIAVGDFNGDGIADLVTSNAGSDSETVLLGKGDGTFTVAASPSVGATPNASAVGDFNGDGLPDVAAANNDANSVTVLLSQETWTAAATATGISPVGTGTHLVDASYPGDSLFGASVSATIGLTALTPPSFAITSTSVTVVAGATTGNISTITVTPSGGFTGSVALTAVLTSSPNDPVNPPTFSFGVTSPVSITSASAGTASLTITTLATAGCGQARHSAPEFPWYRAGGAALACVFFFCIPAQRRRWGAMLGMFLFVAILSTGVVACGGISGISGTCTAIRPPTTSGTYTVTVTGISGAITEQGTVTLIVQ
ncbi:MAG: VCBS repeat-containing protein [Terracidiphilus sp.]|jgi:hypothetical protein